MIADGRMWFKDDRHRKSWLWREAKTQTEKLDGVPIRKSGAILAALNMKYQDVFLEALEVCCSPFRSEPAIGFVAFLTATCQHHAGERAASNSKQVSLEAGNDAAVGEYLLRKSKENKGVIDG